MKMTTRLCKTLSGAILALAVVAGLNNAAQADRDDWHGHAREAREWHHRHWHNGRIIYEDNEPYVTYAPPLVVEPPPPVYYPPEQPGLNIVVPLNIR